MMIYDHTHGNDHFREESVDMNDLLGIELDATTSSTKTQWAKGSSSHSESEFHGSKMLRQLAREWPLAKVVHSVG